MRADSGTVKYCLSNVCFEYLGAKAFDGNKPLFACTGVGSWCSFEHSIPKIPVSKTELVDLLRVAKLVALKQPQKRKALLAVMESPTFSR